MVMETLACAALAANSAKAVTATNRERILQLASGLIAGEAVVGILLAIGMMMVYSTTFDWSYQTYGSQYTIFLQHVRNAAVGFVFMFALAFINYRVWRRLVVNGMREDFSWETQGKLYEDLYKPGLHADLWFRWRGKPLLICNPREADTEVKEFFTLRRAHWPFTIVNTPYAWHWEAAYPQVYGYTDDPNRPEQVNVSVAQNLRISDGLPTNMSEGTDKVEPPLSDDREATIKSSCAEVGFSVLCIMANRSAFQLSAGPSPRSM